MESAAMRSRRDPQPFRQFIVKLHGRCNLACDYCYVYTMADQRWRARPHVMSRRLIEHTADRIAEHARGHRLNQVDIVVHGGEPLLAGRGEFAYLVAVMRSRIPAAVRICVQTNGTLLDVPFLELFRELDVRVGVSLDGDAAAHDRHRTGPGRQVSHQRVRTALELLATPRFRRLFAGVLCVVDVRNDPLTTYEALLEFSPPKVDFLLPHGNWSSPPADRIPGSAATPYADWLITVFDRWYEPAGYRTGVRIFEEIINVLLGGSSRVEGIGMSPMLAIVIETDGTIQQLDSLSSAFEGAGATGLHVDRDSFDTVSTLPNTLARPMGVRDLPATCQTCRIHRICGGGLRTHRYSKENAFDQPSVYCPDLYRLIDHIGCRVRRDLLALQ